MSRIASLAMRFKGPAFASSGDACAAAARRFGDSGIIAASGPIKTYRAILFESSRKFPGQSRFRK